MKPIESEDMDLICRVLPALRMMHKFPTRSPAVAALEMDISEAEIRKFLAKYGRPKAKEIEEMEFRVSGRIRRLSKYPRLLRMKEVKS